MGSCCFTNKSPVESTPLVSGNVPQDNYCHGETEREMLRRNDGNNDTEIFVGKKRTMSHQQEGPPEKAPTMSERASEEDAYDDQCDGVPLHLPVDAAATAASDSPMDSMLLQDQPNNRAFCIGGINKKPQNCPYCDQEGGNVFFFLTMLEGNYQLLDKLYQAGWWRTGTIFFKPDIRVVCCPNYSIRHEVSKYVMSKSHRAIVRRFKNFLCNGDGRWKDDALLASLPEPQKNTNLNKETGTKKRKQKGPVQPGKGADPSKPPCRKAKEIRKEKWVEKQRLRGEVASTPKQPQNSKTIEEILEDADSIVPGQKHQFRQELLPCKPLSQKLNLLLKREYEIYCKFQDRIHKEKSKFHSYDEYVWGFVESVVTNDDGRTAPGVRQGTYHIHYYLDEELVMVTIADITPSLFISIYFFYDPDIRFIHPGIYTVIREIALTRQLQKVMPNLKYYILGYYNFTIPKISYKDQFRPTEIQCPDTYHWLPLKQVVSRIADNQYVRLSDDEYDPKIDRNVDNLMVSMYSMVFQYGILPHEAQMKRQMLSKLVQEFGPYGISDEIILNITANLDL